MGVDAVSATGKTSTGPADIAISKESGSDQSLAEQKDSGAEGEEEAKGEKEEKTKNESGLPSNGSTTSISSLAAERMIGKLVDDEVIPTAIVIKNIPFAVQKETLLAIIVSPFILFSLSNADSMLFAGESRCSASLRLQLPS